MLTNGNLGMARRVLCIAGIALTCYLLLSNVLVLNATGSLKSHPTAKFNKYTPAFPNQPAVNLSNLALNRVQNHEDSVVVVGNGGADNVVAYDGFDGGQKQGQGPRLAPPKAAPDAHAHAELHSSREAAASTDEHISNLINSSASLSVVENVVSEMSNDTNMSSTNQTTGIKWLSDEENGLEDQLPLCPEPSPLLEGRLHQAVLLIPGLKEQAVLTDFPELKPGGHWKPAHCKSRYKVAVIFPFRDRQSHLTRLIYYLIPMLQRQLLDFRFIVTEQYGHDLFNKGRIMNAAFTLAEKLGVDCVIFHDVDMFPQDDRCPYSCPKIGAPRHIGAFVNSLGYELWYDYLVGGVLALSIADYKRVNGYSNLYWAWGGEDDDMGKRIQAIKLTIERPEKSVSGFTMLKHVKRTQTARKSIYELLETVEKRMLTDGLAQESWRILKVTKSTLYYHMYVDVGIPPDEWRNGT